MRIAPLADVKTHLSAYLEQCEAEGILDIRLAVQGMSATLQRWGRQCWRSTMSDLPQCRVLTQSRSSTWT